MAHPTLVDTSGWVESLRSTNSPVEPVDCLVAAIALEHGLAVLGSDRDLRTLHEVCGLELVGA